VGGEVGLFAEVKAEYPTILRENEAIEMNPEAGLHREPVADVL
jgi:hypothetical protein